MKKYEFIELAVREFYSLPVWGCPGIWEAILVQVRAGGVAR